MTSWKAPTGLGTSLALAAGAGLGQISPAGWFGAGSVAMIVLILSIPRRGTGPRLAAIGATLMLALSSGGLRSVPEEAPLPSLDSAWVAGRVRRWEALPWGLDIRIDAYQFGPTRLSRPRRVRIYAPLEWGRHPQSRWLGVRGRVREERRGTVPDAPPPQAAARVFPHPSTGPHWGPGNPDPVYRWRSRLLTVITRQYREFPARLAQAILLGRSRVLETGERDAFRRAGASHIVAVSGLHVGLVSLLVGVALSPLGLRSRLVGALLAAWIYAALAGWSPSALRATVLVTAVTAGSLGFRPRSAAAWLALALPWLLWFDPALSRSVSFLLSVGAVSGILLALDLVGRKTVSGVGPLSLIVASVGAQWGTLPTSVTVFGAFSPLALLPNLVVIPLAGLYLPAVFLGILTHPIPLLSSLFTEAAGLLAMVLLEWITFSAKVLPFVHGLLKPSPLVPVLYLLFISLWFSTPEPFRGRVRVRLGGFMLAALLAGSCFLSGSPPPGPWVAFLDVGQGDAAVFRLSDGSVWVVDVGDDRGPGDGARNAVIPYLRHNRITRVNGLILSHRHRDHIGALGSLLQTIPVDRVYDAGYGSVRGSAGVVDSVLAHHGLTSCLIAAGDTLLHQGAVSIIVLHPPRGNPEGDPPGGNLNEASVMVLVQDEPMRILFAGDGEQFAEASYVKNGPHEAVGILKVGHHGSSTSSSPEFLDAVRPEWGIISCGSENQFGHPSDGVLERFRNREITVFRTDQDGSVVFRFDRNPAIPLTYPPVPTRRE